MSKKKAYAIYSYLSGKVNVGFLRALGICALLYVIFYQRIISVISENIVDLIFKDFISSDYIDFVWLLSVVVFIIIFGFRIRRNYQISLNSLSFQFVFLIAYMWEKNNSNFFFFSLHEYEPIKYLDILFLAFFTDLLLLMRNIFYSVKTEDKNNVGLLSDLSPLSIKEDLFSWKNNIEYLVGKIKETKSDSAFAIGVIAAWGNGKSTFLKFLKSELKDTKNVIIEFNPWMSLNKSDMITDYFATLQEGLKKYDSSLSKELNQYSDLLSKLKISGIVGAVVGFLTFYSKKDIQSTFNNINKKIGLLGRKIYIFIDDLDRLQRDELLEVLKLIRNSSNFKNTCFIVAYDREYVVNAIGALKSDNYNGFLEKIFQLEVELPMIDALIVRKELVRNLKSYLPKDYHSEVEKLISPNSSQDYPLLDYFITNLRDVKRFVNYINLYFKQVEKEVVFFEYMNISMAKYKYCEVVDFIFRRQNEYFEKRSEDKGIKFKLIKTGEKTNLVNELLENSEKLNIGKLDALYIGRLFEAIFGVELNYLDMKAEDEFQHLMFVVERDPKSIVHPNYFYRYFTHQILSHDISSADWEELLEKSFEDIVVRLSDYIKEGNRKEVFDRLAKIKIFKDREHFEDHIKMIFALSLVDSDKDQNKYEKQYDYSKLYSLLYKTEDIVESYYGSEKEQYLIFVKTLLSSEDNPYVFSSGFISFILNDPNYHDKFILSTYDLVQINLSYLRKYLQKATEMDEIAWDLYKSCYYIVLSPDMKVLKRNPARAKRIVKGFLDSKDIKYIITKIAIKREGKYFYFSGDITHLYGSYEKFYEYLNGKGNSAVIEEFNKFYEEQKKSNFQTRIAFKFEVIKFD